MGKSKLNYNVFFLLVIIRIRNAILIANGFSAFWKQALHRGAVVAQWTRPRTFNREVPGSNLLAAAVVPLGKALYPHCLVPRKGLKAVGPLVACL